MKFTRIYFMYRDADNYKERGELDVTGEITADQRQAIADALDSGEYFIPEQVGIQHLLEDSTWVKGDADHCWHEMDPADIEVLDTEEWKHAKPTGTVEEIVGRFVQAGKVGWKETAHGARFVLRQQRRNT